MAFPNSSSILAQRIILAATRHRITGLRTRRRIGKRGAHAGNILALDRTLADPLILALTALVVGK